MDPRSPRASGKEFQYENLSTPLGGKHYIADVLLPDNPWHTWDGKPVPPVDLSKQTPENYDGAHNHYQTMLVELTNATPGANGVPFWADGTASVKDSLAWGAFVSARSSCAALVTSRLPASVQRPKVSPEGCPEDFDAQLTGLEVDVLNDGKPGMFGNKAKHGVQVVGFGNPNSSALSVIAHGFDRPEGEQDGQFESVLYSQKALHPDYGRFIVSDQDRAMMGLDFRKTLFKNGALQLNTAGTGTGVLFSDGVGGEVTAGDRWPDGQAGKWLTMRAGEAGIRLLSNDGTKEVLAADQHGGIYLNGDVFLNGQPLAASGVQPSRRGLLRPLVAGAAGATAASLAVLIGAVLLARSGRLRLTPAATAQVTASP